MKRRHLAIAVAAVIAAAATTAVTAGAGHAAARADTVYTRTVVGTDFRPIDFRVSAQFAAGTGGGVYSHVPGATIPSAVYLEAPVDLQVNAHVTGVTFYYLDCGFAHPLALYYFGSYNPATKAYTEILPEASGGSGVCFHAYTLTRAKPMTVKLGYRYILGVHSLYTSQGASPPGDGPPWVISGARVRFTCPTGCDP